MSTIVTARGAVGHNVSTVAVNLIHRGSSSTMAAAQVVDTMR